MEETISLKEIFDIIKKRIALIIVTAFVGVGIASGITFFLLTPKYQSAAELIVTLPQTETANANDVNTNLQMINTYKTLIKSENVLEVVQARLENEYGYATSVGALKESIAVVQDQNSMMFQIQSTGPDALETEHIANLTAEVFQENAKEVFTGTVDKVSIISRASASMAPISPNNKLNVALGLVLGLMVGVGLAFVFELFDKTVKDNKFVSETLGMTILGTVPEMSEKELKSTIQKHSASSIVRRPSMATISEETDSLNRRSRTKI